MAAIKSNFEFNPAQPPRTPQMPASETIPEDVRERLRKACVGHPHAKIAWPHRLLHEAIAEIERLEAESRHALEAWRQAIAALEPYWGTWITHRGQKDPPVDGASLVMVLFRDNDQAIGRMHDWDENWQWDYGGPEHDGDIIMYRSLQPLQPLQAAEARCDKLAEALRPFAAEADARATLALGPDIDDWPIGGSSLTLGNIRRAREALEQVGKP